jgi:hypothetical protein
MTQTDPNTLKGALISLRQHVEGGLNVVTIEISPSHVPENFGLKLAADMSTLAGAKVELSFTPKS